MPVGTRNRKGSTRNSDDETVLLDLSESDKFTHIVQRIVQRETGKLLKIVEDLKQEVVILRESNIELVNLLTNSNSNINNALKSKQLLEHYSNKNQEINKPQKNFRELKNKSDKDSEKTQPIDNNKINESKTINPIRKDNARSNFNKKKVEILTGTLLSDGNSKLRGVEKKAWLHISKFKYDNLESSDILDYIKKDINTSNCICEKFKTFIGNHIYFKLGIPYESLDKVYNSNYWPQGVEIKKFLFRPKNEMFQSDSENPSENHPSGSR